jgi:hypothetical protein
VESLLVSKPDHRFASFAGIFADVSVRNDLSSHGLMHFLRYAVGMNGFGALARRGQILMILNTLFAEAAPNILRGIFQALKVS